MGENNDLQETSVLGVQKFWVLVPENLWHIKLFVTYLSNNIRYFLPKCWYDILVYLWRQFVLYC
jgi:hypothetical protein